MASSLRESKYISSCIATKKALWLSRLFCDTHVYSDLKAFKICIDNTGSMSTAQNISIKQWNMQIDIQYRFVRAYVVADKVIL